MIGREAFLKRIGEPCEFLGRILNLTQRKGHWETGIKGVIGVWGEYSQVFAKWTIVMTGAFVELFLAWAISSQEFLVTGNEDGSFEMVSNGRIP